MIGSQLTFCEKWISGLAMALSVEIKGDYAIDQIQSAYSDLCGLYNILQCKIESGTILEYVLHHEVINDLTDGDLGKFTEKSLH